MLRGSPDEPLTQEDAGAFLVRAGTQKRLLGNVRALRQVLNMEAEVYLNRAQAARRLRNYKADIVEVCGGHAEITHQAPRHGLRALQPVDRRYDIELLKQRDHVGLRQLLHKWKPFLTVWEIACTLWSNVQRLNYTAEEIHLLRKTQDLEVKEMCKTITELVSEGGHFLLETTPRYRS